MPFDEVEANNQVVSNREKTHPQQSSMETGAVKVEKLIPSERSARETGGVVEVGRATPEIPSVGPAEILAAGAPAVDPMAQKYKRIEQILEEDLGEIYNNLSPQEQKLFKIKGEETARSIFQLVYRKTKVKVKKIIKLIKEWLKTIPGINKFFLEQEAKIKADKIVELIGEDKKKVKF